MRRLHAAIHGQDRGSVIRRIVIGAVLPAVLLAAVGCSSDNKSNASASSSSPPTTQPRPPGPAAEFSTESTGGNGVYLASATDVDLAAAGYEQHEYFASGTATSYAASSGLTPDGRWSFVPSGTADYKTRVLVRRPTDPKRFSGNVVVEWLNVSGGVDTDAEFVSTREELLRAGDVWVGVSAQLIGVEGGPVLVQVSGVAGAENAGKGLKNIDPARYGSLHHPGDGYSFDIYTQVARAIRSGSGLAGLQPPQRLIAAGQSQSAYAMVTYYNGVQPLSDAFDGFFVHSRGSGELPLVAPGQYADFAGAVNGAKTVLRPDVSAPVLDLQTETDVENDILGSSAVRQPDSDRFRLWEVAGTAHFDKTLLSRADAYQSCGSINDGPMHVVAIAGMHALKTWLATNTAPPTASRFELTTDPKTAIVRDADGIAAGGVRTPPVDVPVATLSGSSAQSPSLICQILGSTTPFTQARLGQLYPSVADYQQRYDASTDAAIKTGFVLPEDRDLIKKYENATGIPT
jgi:hypothetical protein